MRSIRSFLIVVTLAAIVLVIFVAVFQGYRKGIDQTQHLLDSQLEHYARLILLVKDRNTTPLPSNNQFQYQTFDLQGNLLMRSDGAPSDPMLALDFVGVTDSSFGGQRWRVLHYRAPQQMLSVQVAETVGERFAIAEQIVNATLLPILLGIPILAMLAWGIITLGLRHLSRLAKALSERGADNLTVIELPGIPSELDPVLESMNNMLTQVAKSFEREQRFASDAAHELRTPISALKVNVYNLSKQLTDNADLRGLSVSLTRMAHLIDQLLLLYRASSDNLRTEFEPVNLRRLCEDVIRDRYPRILERGQEIELEAANLSILGNQFALSALVANLVDNASKFTPQSGHIRLELAQVNGCVELLVEDSGIGISTEFRERVMDRFFRINTGSSVQGCGLGLSIVQHVVALHDARFSITDSQFETGTQVAVRFHSLKGDIQ